MSVRSLHDALHPVPGSRSRDRLLKPVLVCDDDPDMVRLVSAVLKADGFEVVDALSFRDAVDQAHLHSLTAAIVDQKLPDGDGVELCRRLREDNGTLPVLVLSGVPDEQAKIRALDAGADDYITKPFGCGELMARLRAVLRRAEPPPPEPVLAIDGLEIDLAAYTVRLDDVEIHLTPIEFELLRMLIERRGHLVTHDALLLEVWGPACEHDRMTLQSHVANLRRKIDPYHRRIATEFGLGYRFVG